MAQQTQQLQCFLTATKQPQPITEKHQFQKPQNKSGRPSERLSEDQLKQAAAILTFDQYKQGRIKRWTCPVHGRKALSYRYQKSDGVHAWCEVAGCKATNHWDETHYDGRIQEEQE